jgi:SNF2 family DNA or RNA helicase
MWQKQKEALATLKKRVNKGKGCCLFAEMGTGKTRVVVHLLEYMFSTQGVRLVYIAGPLAALHVWVENWHEWATAPVAFIDLHDSGSAGIREAKRLATAGFPVICLVNYEAAWQIGYHYVKRMRRGEEVSVLEKYDTALADFNWDMGILDESTAIKTPGSRVSKFFRRKMAPRTTHKLVMTGSAYIKRPLDVWAQVNYACGAEVFAPVFAHFRAMYAIPHPAIRGAIAGYQNLNDFVWRLSKVAILLKKEDVLDLPPVIHTTRMVDLTAKSQRIYDQLKEELYVELEATEVRSKEYKKLCRALDGLDEESKEARAIMRQMEELEAQGPVAITAEHVFSRIRKFMQITSGFIYPDATEVDERGRPIKPDAIRLGKEKLEELLNLLELRDGKPTVIVVQMDEEEAIISEAIGKKFKFKPKILNGSVKGAQARHELIAAAAGDPAFIVKQSVGAKGVDMRWADMTIFYSHDYDTEDYEQMLARNHRGGQTKPITYVHLLCRNSIDIKVMAALKKDLDLAQSIEHDWRQLF